MARVLQKPRGLYDLKSKSEAVFFSQYQGAIYLEEC